jgi:F0F1-type ATP synthase membrane subunit b/b'
MIRKTAGPFFAERGAAILREIAQARTQVEQSEARAQAVEARLALLSREIDDWKAKAKAELAAEHARIERETEQAVRKIFALCEQEITAATKAARAELIAYTAHLAVELAERKIAARMTPDVQRSLLASFLRHL